MSVQASTSRPGGKSIAAAFLGIAVTLLIFVAVFVTFLIAPLVALLLAFLAYAVMRPRSGGRSSSSTSTASPQQAAHGFGTGTQA